MISTRNAASATTFPPMDVESEAETDVQQAWLQAAHIGHVAELRLLLQAHPHLLHVCERFEHLHASTALHLCAWANRAEAAAFLLEKGANVEACDAAGNTPVQIDLLRVCMEQMRPMPLVRCHCIDTHSPVEMALYKRRLVRDRSTYEAMDTSNLEVLLRHGADINRCSERGDCALLLAVEDGFVKHVRLLLEHGADVTSTDAKGRSPLVIAAEHGYADIVHLLLQQHPSLVDADGPRALLAAVHHDSVAVVEVLFAAVMIRISRTRQQQEFLQWSGELLHTAVEFDAPACLAFLLAQEGMSINWRNADGDTAVHVACTLSRPQLLAMLLEHNADANLCAITTGASPFHMAVRYCGFEEITVLAKAGANINLMDRHFQTPLLAAVIHGHSVQLMHHLIDHGAHCRFHNHESRDQVVPVLADWISHTAQHDVTQLVENLVDIGLPLSDCMRGVITSVARMHHNVEALLVVLLALFSSPPPCVMRLALRVVTEWLEAHHGDSLARHVLEDALL